MLGKEEIRKTNRTAFRSSLLAPACFGSDGMGFNAGSELNVNAITGLAFLNTDVAASFAAITWMVIEWSRVRQPKFVGLLTGAVAGLATITPAAGYVSLPAAVIIGTGSGIVCYLARSFEK